MGLLYLQISRHRLMLTLIGLIFPQDIHMRQLLTYLANYFAGAQIISMNAEAILEHRFYYSRSKLIMKPQTGML
jgi:hypothetical protein